jgi:hypothetical protein
MEEKINLEFTEIGNPTDWQVLASDEENWLTGISSPAQSSPEEFDSFESLDAPEFFMLTRGKVNLLVRDQEGERVVELTPFKPVMVNGWHRTFCPNGPRTGTVLVIERPNLKTDIRARHEFN